MTVKEIIIFLHLTIYLASLNKPGLLCKLDVNFFLSTVLHHIQILQFYEIQTLSIFIRLLETFSTCLFIITFVNDIQNQRYFQFSGYYSCQSYQSLKYYVCLEDGQDHGIYSYWKNTIMAAICMRRFFCYGILLLNFNLK